jgi:flagellar hook assembly protein FlgD
LLVLRFFPAGRHELTWDGTDQAGNPVGSGIYHIRLEAGSGVQHQKVVIVQSGP